MASKSKLPVLKGQEAEDKVLQYMKKMNRPYGAIDVAANLKGAVPKATVQKILAALAEKGELTQKVYGKSTFFVYNQSKLESLPHETIASLKADLSSIEDDNRVLAAEVKSLSAELAKLKSAPTDEELASRLTETESAIAKLDSSLRPLRSGAPPISAEEREQIQAAWVKWRAEWVRRRKIFVTFWQLVTDALPPQEAKCLEEDLGIELDTPEHGALERGPLCAPTQANPLKRKRQ